MLTKPVPPAVTPALHLHPPLVSADLLNSLALPVG